MVELLSIKTLTATGTLIVSFSLLYIAWMLYPGEEQELKNRLEEWWYRLTYRGDESIRMYVIFLSRIAQPVLREIDYLFESRLFLFSHSTIIAQASILLYSASYVASPNVAKRYGLADVILAFLPLFAKKRRWLRTGVIVYAGLLWAVCILFVWMAYPKQMFLIVAGMIAPTILGQVIYVFMLVLVRSVVAGLIVNKSLPVIGAFVLSCAPLAVYNSRDPVGVALALAAERFVGQHLGFVFRLGWIGAATCAWLALWPTILFGMILLVIFLHRTFWWIAGRTIHALWRHDIFQKRIFLTGCACVLLAAGGWSWVSDLIKKLT